MMLVALAQGTYYVATGAWPLVDDRSFQAVTGPKVDVWLVKTVGVLVAAIGTALLLAGRRRDARAPDVALALGSALGLAAIDVAYVRRGRIGRVYLLDAAAELALVLWWVVALSRRRTRTRPPPSPST